MNAMGSKEAHRGWEATFLVDISNSYLQNVVHPKRSYRLSMWRSWWKFMEVTTSMPIGFCMCFGACTFRFFSVGSARHSERALDGLLPPFDGGSGWNDVETALTTSVTFKGILVEEGQVIERYSHNRFPLDLPKINPPQKVTHQKTDMIVENQ